MKDRVKQARKAAGYKTQTDFAKALGVAKNTVCNWETGETIPRNMVSAICRLTRVRDEWLREGSGEMFESESAADKLTAERICEAMNARPTVRAAMQAYAELSEPERDIIDRFINLIIEQRQPGETTTAPDADPQPQSEAQ